MPHFNTLIFKGVVEGKAIIILLDKGATHNFIDTSLVERSKFTAKKFEGFTEIIPGNHSMDYTKWIPNIQVTIGNYMITNIFYVVNVADTNFILGLQGLYYIGEHMA